MITNLGVTLRPKTLNEIIGQDATVEAVKDLLNGESFPAAFLFSSDANYPGVGKTTFGYCIADYLKSKGVTVRLHEVDAAADNGVDGARAIIQQAREPFVNLSANRKKAVNIILLNEAQRSTSAAQDILLSTLETEDKYRNFIIVITTTEVSKLRPALKTRCKHFKLKPLDEKSIGKIIDNALTVTEKTISSEVRSRILENANGSARQALADLEAILFSSTDENALEILGNESVTPEQQSLINAIVSGFAGKDAKGNTIRYDWNDAITLIMKWREAGAFNAETFRIQLRATAVNTFFGRSTKPTKMMEAVKKFDDVYHTATGKKVDAVTHLTTILKYTEPNYNYSKVDQEAQIVQLLLNLMSEGMLA